MELSIINLPVVILVVGLGLVGLVSGTYVALRGTNIVRDRLDQYVHTPDVKGSPVDLGNGLFFHRIRSSFNVTFSILNNEEMQRKLIAANWQISPGEFLFIRMGAAFLGFLLSSIAFGSLIPAVGIAVLAYTLPGLFLFQAIQKRQKQFQDQLIDLLTLIRGSVEAGYSFLQAINVVINQMTAPASDELRQVRREVELGLPLNRALNNMAQRMDNDDFYLVVTAVNINMQVGGNLSQILGVVIDTIRNRIYLFSEIRSLTSYARFASYLLTLLPFFTIVIFSFMNPLYFERLFEPGITRFILIYAAISLVIGNTLMRLISKINV